MKTAAKTSLGLALALLGATAGEANLPHPNNNRGFSPETAFAAGDVDNVNLFNGNLVVTIPIGGSYPVGGGFSYHLMLVYNSTPWDWELYCPGGVTCTTRAWVNSDDNAGIGWQLTLGHLVAPGTVRNPSTSKWMYVAPDGSEHLFYPTLHAGDADDPGDSLSAEHVQYTRDGSYLRMTDLAGGERKIESPDGTIHTMRSDGRARKIEDRFGNALTILYQTLTSSTSEWVLTDTTGRTQTIHFTNRLMDGQILPMVDYVDLAAFAGTTARYTFRYDPGPVQVERPCPHNESTTVMDNPVEVPLLVGIDLPDGSSWEMPQTDYNLIRTAASCKSPGSLQGLTLPTLGRIEWTYQTYVFASGSGVEIDPSHPGKLGGWRKNALGVATRRTKDANGAVLGTWTYTPQLEDTTGTSPLEEPVEQTTTVVDPLGHKRVHYFAAYAGGFTSRGARASNYGLPFTILTSDGSSPPRYLSMQVFAGGTTLERSTYVRYEQDGYSGDDGEGSLRAVDSRMASERVDFNDDAVAGGFRFKTMDSSNFDGLGHYRQQTTGGNFAAGNVRTSVTSYNPARGTYLIDPDTNQPAPEHTFVMLPSSSPWVLNTYTDESVTENGVTAKSQFCFEASTGYLLRKRDDVGTAPGAHDVVSQFERDGTVPLNPVHGLGQTTTERTFGGDVQTLSTSSNLCGLALPAAYYQVEHSYQYGVLATSRYRSPQTGILFPYLSLDQTIDRTTGLVSSSRDTAGLPTTYLYDNLGRLTWVRPQSGNRDGWTEYQYFRATSPSSLPKIFIHTHHNGSTGAPTLSESEIWFDALGRVQLEKTKMPDGTYQPRETLYNGAGLKASVSEMGFPGKKTLYLNYDPFGRPGTIRPPDGSAHDVSFAYQGTRQVNRTVRVATGRDASGNPTETASTTQEIYDGQGHLLQVIEPSGVGGANTTTSYTYDIGSRLSQVSTTSGTVTQVRRFTYDHLGFLRSEQHPEKGPSGNGTVSYFTYDPRGHAGRTIDGPNDLLFSFDRAERLTAVRETATGNPLKEFVYASGNGAGDLANGKLKMARRYNYVVLGTTPVTDKVEETYTYGGREGRVSSRSTDNYIRRDSQPNPSLQLSDAFTQSFVYDELGNTSSLDYPRCTMCRALPSRTVTNDYTAGFLTSVSFEGTAPASGGQGYFTVPPCRLFDSRASGKLSSNQPVVLEVSGQCGVPASAKAVSVNVIAIQPSGDGFLVLYPGDLPSSSVSASSLNFAPSTSPRANNGIVRLATNGSGTLGLLPVVAGAGQVHLVVDITGYFSDDPSALAPAEGPFGFEALPPCRVVDTRFGGGPLQAGVRRDFQVQGLCGVPVGAAAASINMTVVQPTSDGYVTLFASGEAQPATSNINVKAGQSALANGVRTNLGTSTLDLAAIFGAGGGEQAHLVLDVNGEFSTGAPLRFHPVTPCRAVDTRVAGTGAPSLAVGTTRTFQIRGTCGVPVGAQAAVLNLTVVGPTSAGYLTAFASGTTRPLASTINFDSGETALANTTITPLSTETQDLAVFAGGSTNLIVDVFGYFDRGTTTATTTASLTYHPNGLVNQVIHGNGVVDTQASDPNGIARPASLTSTKGTTTLFTTGSYAYDGAGNIAKIGTSWFTYDKVSRVTTGTVFDGSTGGGGQHQQTYTYDAFGNLTAIGGSPGRSIPVNAATNRLTGAAYDAAGNVISWNGNTYEYDRFNQMWHMTSDQEEYIYLYTADDERLWSFQVNGPQINRWTIRDLGGKVLREYTYARPPADTWAVDHDYIYRDGQLLASDGASGQRQYSLDHLGTPRLLTSAAGLQTAYHAYLPFGEEATYFNQDAERMKFTGQERDLANLSGTGDDLDYMHARFCNPMLGRFLSTDPSKQGWDMKRPQSWNRYSYTESNPLTFVDPTGEAVACPPNGSNRHPLCPPQSDSYWARVQYQMGLASMLPGPSAIAATPEILAEYGVASLDALRAGEGLLAKLAPAVTDQKLAVVVSRLFKFGDTMAGGTANALRVELATGEPTIGVSGRAAIHIQAGIERLGTLEKLLHAGGLDAEDVEAAFQLIHDLQASLAPLLSRLGVTGRELLQALMSGEITQDELLTMMAK